MRSRMVIAALVLTVIGCADRPPTVDDVAGVYRAEIAGTTRLPPRAVVLRLDVGNVATMEVAVEGRTVPVVESGTWSVTPEGGVRVVLARDGFGPVTNDVSFRWARATLTAIAFDTLQWGASGFALSRE